MLVGPASSAHPLARRLMATFESPAVLEEAAQNLDRTNGLGLRSDWSGFGTSKELDFARLVTAVKRTFPPGGTVETGVFAGGTSGLLLLSCSPESFHVSVDPYGLASQSYGERDFGPGYREWAVARATARRLAQLAEESDVTYFHYLTDSATFCRSDLLQHPDRFNIVHLDGDHSASTVKTELAYFISKVPGPAVFVLDDHDDHCPGVDRALGRFRDDLSLLFHRTYALDGYGIAGFSAWFRGDGRRSRFIPRGPAFAPRNAGR